MLFKIFFRKKDRIEQKKIEGDGRKEKCVEEIRRYTIFVRNGVVGVWNSDKMKFEEHEISWCVEFSFEKEICFCYI